MLCTVPSRVLNTDHMIHWSHDPLVTWPTDHMTHWSHDPLTTWSHMITWPTGHMTIPVSNYWIYCNILGIYWLIIFTIDSTACVNSECYVPGIVHDGTALWLDDQCFVWPMYFGNMVSMFTQQGVILGKRNIILAPEPSKTKFSGQLYLFRLRVWRMSHAIISLWTGKTSMFLCRKQWWKSLRSCTVCCMYTASSGRCVCFVPGPPCLQW